jgi:hypothetical protein
MDHPKPAALGKGIKVVALALVVSLVPALRSCGGISLGFPTVAYDFGNHGLADLRPINLLINAVIIGLIALLIAFAYARIKKPGAKRLIGSGFAFLGIYQLLVVLGYAVVYPILMKTTDKNPLAWIGMGYAYFIHPYMELARDWEKAIPEAWSSSSLFGDELDIPMRLGYLGVCCLWFGVGILKALVFKREKKGKTKERSAGDTAP